MIISNYDKFDSSRIQTPILILSICGGISAFISEVLTYPLDNIKTKMQMNGKQGMIRYNSFTDCISKTFKCNGINGFYRGVSGAVIRQTPYSTVRMFIYEHINQNQFQSNPNFIQKLLSGALSGAIGCLFGTPGEIIKIRLINDINSDKYKGPLDCWLKSIRESGYKVIFKGLDINIYRAILVNGSELAVYDQSKQFLMNNFKLKQNSFFIYFISSLAAGLMSAIASSPLDVIKSRYLNQIQNSTILLNNSKELFYKNPYHCAQQIYKNEGFFSFYKGFIPYYLRMAPWSLIFFISYENCKQIYYFSTNKF